MVDNIKNYLLEKDIKPSYQRIKILEYLRTKKNHPTVDMIYKELVKEIPTLSKTTVYNTLNSFVKKDIARVITIEEGETRFDANTKNHGHFKCTNCNSIYDFKVNENVVEKE